MGYYSDVALALTRKGVQKLHENLDDKSINDAARAEIVDLLATATKHHKDEDSGSEIWYWENIKWYACAPKYFPDVCFIDNFLGKVDFSDYRFVRVGEDNEDTEAHGGFTNDPFDLTLSRHISLADAL